MSLSLFCLMTLGQSVWLLLMYAALVIFDYDHCWERELSYIKIFSFMNPFM